MFVVGFLCSQVVVVVVVIRRSGQVSCWVLFLLLLLLLLLHVCVEICCSLKKQFGFFNFFPPLENLEFWVLLSVCDFCSLRNSAREGISCCHASHLGVVCRSNSRRIRRRSWRRSPGTRHHL